MKSNEQKELEMTQAWLVNYMEQLKDVPGNTIQEKIEHLKTELETTTFIAIGFSIEIIVLFILMVVFAFV